MQAGQGQARGGTGMGLSLECQGQSKWEQAFLSKLFRLSALKTFLGTTTPSQVAKETS